MTPGQAPLPPLPPKWTGKFTKRPVTVEAVQLVDDLRNHTEIAAWIEANGGHAEIPFAEPCLHIETLEGRMRASLGDWVIKGVKGEFYPCKPDIFEATYEPAALAAREPRAADGNAPELRITDCSAHGDALHVQVNTGHNWLCAVALAAILAEYEPQPAEPPPAPGHVHVMRGTIAVRDAEIEILRARIAELSEALAKAAGHVEPVDQNSELAIGGWLELAKRGTEEFPRFAQPEPQPAAAAMAEARGYRDALQEVRAIIREGGSSTEGSRLRRSRAVIRKALEGK